MIKVNKMFLHKKIKCAKPSKCAANNVPLQKCVDARQMMNSLIIIIMIAYFYCTAYTRMTMYESLPPCEQRRIIFNDDGQRLPLARPELPAPHYICKYRLLPTTPPSPSRHYYPRLFTGINLPTKKGWIAWLATADCTHITFAQGYYTIGSKVTRRK